MRESEPWEEEPAHDILAAEAFAVPTPDPALRHGPVALPEDPAGVEEPHDILAAEAFALPAPRDGFGGSLSRRGSAARRLTLAAGAALLVLTVLRRLGRR